MSAVSTTQPYPANSLAGRLGGWLSGGAGGLVGQGWAGGAGVSLAKESVLQVSAVGTVHIFKPFF
jgi:hypothetical protein